MQKTFIISYTTFTPTGRIIKEGKIKVKNQLSDLNAKVNLESYLKRKHPNFGYMVVKTCYEDNDIFNYFK